MATIEAKRAYNKAWYQRNRDAIAQRRREYRNRPEVRAQKRALARYTALDRRQYLWNVKWTRGCADCGARPHPVALDFDHRPGGDKVCDVAMMANRHAPWKRLVTEVEKRDVVCANCHRVRTYERGWGANT